MPASPLRYKRLIKELPKHKTAQKALEAAGFSKNTAKSQAKRVLTATLKNEAREFLERTPQNAPSAKKLMSEIVGISGEDLFATLRKIALQDKDYGSALKVLAPLSKEHGVILASDDDKASITVPVLNIMVGKTSTDNMAINGEQQTTPLIDDVKNG